MNKVIIGFHFLVYNFRNSCEFSQTKTLGERFSASMTIFYVFACGLLGV